MVIIHIEVERTFRAAMAERMWRYYMFLRLKYGLTVLPIVLFLRGGSGGIRKRTIEDRFHQDIISSFSYWAMGLERSRAEDLLTTSPLGPALAACTRGGDWPLEQLKYRCLLALTQAKLDDARRYLIINAVETYLDLNTEQEREFHELVAGSPARKEIEAMESTWAERLQTRGQRKLIEKLMTKRFGSLPEAVRRRLAQVEDEEELERLGERLFEAHSWTDLGLGEA